MQPGSGHRLWPRDADQASGPARPTLRQHKVPVVPRSGIAYAAVDARRHTVRCSASQCSKKTKLIGVIDHLPESAGRSRQADRAGNELRRPSRHRHREHAAAQRAARIAPAADRHRRRAQGHQPLDLRSAGGARHAGRVGGSLCEADMAAIARQKGDASIYATIYRFPSEHEEFFTKRSACDREEAASLGERCWKAKISSYARCVGRSRISVG